VRFTNRIGAALAGAAIASIAFSSVASAAPLSYSTFGETVNVGPNTELIISDSSPGFGGLDFTMPSASIDFSDINVLRTIAVPEAGDTCIAGTPRFQLNVDKNDGGSSFDGNVFVYVETAPGVCPPGNDTGDLAEVGGPGDIPGRYDTSQLVSGTQVSTYSATLALFAANPTWQITGIQLLVEGGYHPIASGGDGRQAFTVTPTVDIALPTATSKDECKKGGWENFQRADGTTFKNQGDCIQYVNTGK
jgi:hypothetical protein